MTDKNLLKYFMNTKGMTVLNMSKVLGISESSFYRKMNGVSDFTRNEIQIMKNTLNLYDTDLIKVFFNENLM